MLTLLVSFARTIATPAIVAVDRLLRPTLDQGIGGCYCKHSRNEKGKAILHFCGIVYDTDGLRFGFYTSISI